MDKRINAIAHKRRSQQPQEQHPISRCVLYMHASANRIHNAVPMQAQVQAHNQKTPIGKGQMERPGDGFSTPLGQEIQNVLRHNQAAEEHPQHYRKKQKI